jgi:putative chitinase
MQITVEKMQAIFPRARVENLQRFTPALNAAMAEFGIDSQRRIAGFLAQCAHESGVFSVTVENLNYSAPGLLSVFPKYFDRDSAAAYARQPERIANRVYANRMGNGAESSGDGWRFRGRGLIQLTGKTNYQNCGAGLGRDLIADPRYLELPEGAARSAGWYWRSRAINRAADADDIVLMTKLVNGGSHGLKERTEYYNNAKRVLGSTPRPRI